MVNQVKVVSILMIVQGGLATVMGLLYAIAGPSLMAFVISQEKNVRAADKQALTVVTVYYLTSGLLAIVAGALNIFGGIRGLKFRSRTFLIVSLFANVLALATCYCIPTSIGVMIYGLIVIFNADVAKAFELGDQGVPPEEILRRFQSPSQQY